MEPSRYNDNSIGIPYITGASNFEDGRIIINRWTDSPTTHATIDDLLLTCKGSGVGKMVWCNIENAHIARQIMALRCIDGLYKNYLEIVMLAFLSKIVSKANGLIPGLSRDVILNMTFPLPPFNEQTQIYHKSKEILSYTQQVDKETEKLIDIINITKSKILDLAIRGKLVPQNPNDEPASVLLERIRAEKEELIKQGKIKRDKKESIIFRGDDNSYYEKIGNDIICIDEELPFDIPHNWSWCRLGNIGDWAAGSTPSRSYPEYYNGTIPWLKTGDLNDGYITNIPESISEEALKNTSVRLNPSGSVLIAMYGATIGKLGILTFPATTNQACCACSPLDGINNHYLFYYLLSQKDNFVYRSVGGAQPNISKEKIVTTLMPVPPYEEQRQILDKIDIFFDLIRDIEKSLN
ncbi:restriction endonuclease subunit S [Roseburia intestinalis]|uniref:restriction endonuclease subunit S n=1 Tax=Roseburia intestinalis TaxID=166486 RepID=UPI001A9A5CEB|nr:restriction endonuclease subunit S [Roseburia intestinalis]